MVAGPHVERLADDALPPVVYVLTGLLPLALALEYGLWPAAAIGGGAMLLYLVAPRIMQRTVSVPGPVTIVAALAGGALLGVLGALLAIPVAAGLLLLYEEVLVPRQNRA